MTTKEEVTGAYEAGLSSGPGAMNPHASGVLAAAWRRGRRKCLEDHHAGLMGRAKAAAESVAEKAQ